MPKSTHPGPALRRARRALELRIRDLAAVIGRSVPYLCRIEHAQRPIPPHEVTALREHLARLRKERA